MLLLAPAGAVNGRSGIKVVSSPPHKPSTSTYAAAQAPEPSRDADPVSGPDILRWMDGQCFTWEDSTYEFKLCPFRNATQRELSGGWNSFHGILGVWGYWSLDNVTSDGSTRAFSHMMLTDGTECGDVHRSLEVKLSCDAEALAAAMAYWGQDAGGGPDAAAGAAQGEHGELDERDAAAAIPDGLAQQREAHMMGLAAAAGIFGHDAAAAAEAVDVHVDDVDAAWHSARLGPVEEPSTCRYTTTLFVGAACGDQILVPDDELEGLLAAAMARGGGDSAAADESSDTGAEDVELGDGGDGAQGSDGDASASSESGGGGSAQCVDADVARELATTVTTMVGRLRAAEELLAQQQAHLSGASEALTESSASLSSAAQEAEAALQRLRQPHDGEGAPERDGWRVL